MRYLFAPFVALLAAPALAACPAPPDHATRTAELILELREAPSEAAARPYNDALWRLWLDAPDAEAEALLNAGMAKRRFLNLEGAEADFEALIAYCPDWAEGWNQRAFARFLQGNYEGALGDLEAALERNPAHIGALSGRALTLINMGRGQAGQAALREALALHPWLPERSYLVEDPGEDL